MKLTTRGFSVAVVMAVSSFVCQAENTITLKNGRVMTAKSIEWRETSQEYVLTTGETTLPIPLAQVAKVMVDKPAEFDQAASQVQTRQYTLAIPALEKMTKKYRRLNWDAEAAKLLAQACLESNDPKKAVTAMETLFAVVSRDQVSGKLQMTYWKALLASGATDQLRQELDKVIGTAAPEMVASAYLMRGNLFIKTGDEDAALSDFIKIVTLFQGQKDIQAEALFNAAELLDKARDPRGDEFRKKLKQNYPTSEFATKVTSKPAAK